MTAHIRKVEDGIAIVLSEQAAAALGLHLGEDVTIFPRSGGIQLLPDNPTEEEIEAFMESIDPVTVHELEDWGSPQGEEVW